MQVQFSTTKERTSKPFLSWIKQLEGKEEELDVSEGSFPHLPPPPQTQVSFLDSENGYQEQPSLSYTLKTQEQKGCFSCFHLESEEDENFQHILNQHGEAVVEKEGVTDRGRQDSEKRSMKVTYSQKLHMVQKKPDMPKLPPLGLKTCLRGSVDLKRDTRSKRETQRPCWLLCRSFHSIIPFSLTDICSRALSHTADGDSCSQFRCLSKGLAWKISREINKLYVLSQSWMPFVFDKQ